MSKDLYNPFGLQADPGLDLSLDGVEVSAVMAMHRNYHPIQRAISGGYQQLSPGPIEGRVMVDYHEAYSLTVQAGSREFELMVNDVSYHEAV